MDNRFGTTSGMVIQTVMENGQEFCLAIDERVAAGEPAVVTCSALKKIYRDKLRRQGVVFVYMQGTFDEVMERLSHRQGHFMKPSMLQSQSDILEEPGDDEIHVNVHIGQADPEHEAMAVAGALGL